MGIWSEVFSTSWSITQSNNNTSVFASRSTTYSSMSFTVFYYKDLLLQAVDTVIRVKTINIDASSFVKVTFLFM